MKNSLLFIFIFLSVSSLFAQNQQNEEGFVVEEVDDTTKRDKYIHFFNEDDLLDFEPEEEPVEFKKKKKKRRVYYGHKTKKGFTKKGSRDKLQIESFYYLKEFQEPSPYIKDIYWFDIKKRKIEKDRPNKIDPEKALLLHGPYKRIVGGEVVEKGIYYMGTKHGRWEEWKVQRIKKYKDSIEVEEKTLTSKDKYNRGFTKESELLFYDGEKAQIKEVTPILNGELHGYYFYFFENGKIATQGQYLHGEKAGKWYDYQMSGTRHYRKRITVYPDKFTKEDFDPYISMEWDDTGHVSYDKEEEDKRLKKEEEERKRNEKVIIPDR